MRKAWIGLVIFALIGWGLFGLQIWMASGSHENRIRDNREHQEAITRLKSNVATRDTAILKLQEKMQSDSLKFSVAQSGLKIEIKTLRRRERLSRPDTMVFTRVDSVYAMDDSLIMSLTMERNAIRQDCKVLTDSLISQANDFKQIGKLWETQYELSEKDLTLERKKTKVWKWVSGGLGAVVIWMAIKD